MAGIENVKFNLKADGAFVSPVNALTGHERNLWARKGYPGLSTKDAAVIVREFPITVRRRLGQTK